jgi:hypothetical protein
MTIKPSFRCSGCNVSLKHEVILCKKCYYGKEPKTDDDEWSGTRRTRNKYQ